jgi:hypothetical protein
MGIYVQLWLLYVLGGTITTLLLIWCLSVAEENVQDDFDTNGIVRDGHHLLWGHRHGALRWAPHGVRKVIVTVWNHTACLFLGHHIIGPFEDKPDEEGRVLHVEGYRPGYYPKTCTACCKRWPEGSETEKSETQPTTSGGK